MTEQPTTPMHVRIGRVLAAAKELTAASDLGNAKAMTVAVKKVIQYSKELDRAMEEAGK